MHFTNFSYNINSDKLGFTLLQFGHGISLFFIIYYTNLGAALGAATGTAGLDTHFPSGPLILHFALWGLLPSKCE